MRRMLVRRPEALAAAAICAVIGYAVLPSGAGAQQAGHRRVTVNPSLGGPGTGFRVAFRAGDSAGKVGGMWRYYVVSATGPTRGGGCASQASKYVRYAPAHSRVRVTLRPGSGGWCVGRFRGTVSEQEQPVCQYREICPRYVILLRRIGHFTFRIHAG